MDTARKSTFNLSNGKVITLPIRYKNWKWMMVTFTVPSGQIKKLLPVGLKPILMAPGKALISFGAYEYPDVTALRPYNEFLVSIPVQYKPTVKPALFDRLFLPLFETPFYHMSCQSHLSPLDATYELCRQRNTAIPSCQGKQV